MQIILPLIDAHLVADPAWRQWLTRLGDPSSSPHRRVFMPVALDATAFNVPSPLRELNFLRPSGLPSGPLEHPSPNEIELIARSLLKQLTEALCRFMLAGRQATQSETVAGNEEAYEREIRELLK